MRTEATPAIRVDLALLSALVLLLLFVVRGWADPEKPRRVQFETADGWELVGTARFRGRQRPIAILLHPVGHQRGDWGDFPGALHGAGFTVLALDLRGHGESRSRRKGECSWRGFGPRDFRTMVKDVDAAIRFLDERHAEKEGEKREEGKRAPVYLVGAGYGANLALASASEKKRIAGCVLLSPGLKLRGLSLIATLRGLPSRPILALCGREGDSLGGKAIDRLSHLRHDRLETDVLPIRGRGERLVKQKAGRERVVEWLKEMAE